MSRGRLDPLLLRLADRGLDAGALPALAAALDAEEAEEAALVAEPASPGWLGRQAQALAAFVQRQVAHIQGEAAESKEAWGLLRRRVAGEDLSPVEEDILRAQTTDLVRMVPAAAIAVVAESLPMAGTALITPYVLGKLGLLPSRWREARLREGLQHEADRLREAHAEAEARQVDALIDELRCAATRREEAALASRWDTNGDGELDLIERFAYDEAVERLRGEAARQGHRRRWYLWTDHEVIGPVRLTELAEAPVGVLVNLEDDPAWVRLRDLKPA